MNLSGSNLKRGVDWVFLTIRVNMNKMWVELKFPYALEFLGFQDISAPQVVVYCTDCHKMCPIYHIIHMKCIACRKPPEWKCSIAPSFSRSWPDAKTFVPFSFALIWWLCWEMGKQAGSNVVTCSWVACLCVHFMGQRWNKIMYEKMHNKMAIELLYCCRE